MFVYLFGPDVHYNTVYTLRATQRNKNNVISLSLIIINEERYIFGDYNGHLMMFLWLYELGVKRLFVSVSLLKDTENEQQNNTVNVKNLAKLRRKQNNSPQLKINNLGKSFISF